MKAILLTSLLIFSASVFAEMSQIGDEDLAGVTGQSGVYLSGEISINEEGGPLSNNYFGDCVDASKSCGARLTFQTQQDGGWFVIDGIQGSISFEGFFLMPAVSTSSKTKPLILTFLLTGSLVVPGRLETIDASS